MYVYIVDAEKNIPAKKDSVVNQAQSHRQSLAAIVYRGLFHRLHFGKSHRLSCLPLACAPAF